MRTLLPLGLVAVALAGCATAYVEPPASAATASITFARSETVPRWGHTQTLQTASDERCTTRNRVKDFVPLGSQEHTFRIEAGARRYFVAETIRTEGGAYGFTDTTCAGTVSFIPEAGRTYTMSHAYAASGGCAFVIKDTATGQTPASLTVHTYDRNCIQVW